MKITNGSGLFFERKLLSKDCNESSKENNYLPVCNFQSSVNLFTE